jgi:hypothetical protein
MHRSEHRMSLLHRPAGSAVKAGIISITENIAASSLVQEHGFLFVIYCNMAVRWASGSNWLDPIAMDSGLATNQYRCILHPLVALMLAYHYGHYLPATSKCS